MYDVLWDLCKHILMTAVIMEQSAFASPQQPWHADQRLWTIYMGSLHAPQCFGLQLGFVGLFENAYGADLDEACATRLFRIGHLH